MTMELEQMLIYWELQLACKRGELQGLTERMLKLEFDPTLYPRTRKFVQEEYDRESERLTREIRHYTEMIRRIRGN